MRRGRVGNFFLIVFFNFNFSKRKRRHPAEDLVDVPPPPPKLRLLLPYMAREEVPFPLVA